MEARRPLRHGEIDIIADVVGVMHACRNGVGGALLPVAAESGLALPEPVAGCIWCQAKWKLSTLRRFTDAELAERFFVPVKPGTSIRMYLVWVTEGPVTYSALRPFLAGHERFSP